MVTFYILSLSPSELVGVEFGACFWKRERKEGRTSTRHDSISISSPFPLLCILHHGRLFLADLSPQSFSRSIDQMRFFRRQKAKLCNCRYVTAPRPHAYFPVENGCRFSAIYLLELRLDLWKLYAPPSRASPAAFWPLSLPPLVFLEPRACGFS